MCGQRGINSETPRDRMATGKKVILPRAFLYARPVRDAGYAPAPPYLPRWSWSSYSVAVVVFTGMLGSTSGCIA